MPSNAGTPALVRAPIAIERAAAASAQGLSPQQIRQAYALPAGGAGGQRIAIISAFNDPHVAVDLAAYTKHYGVAPCTEASGCLRIINEQGKTKPLPQLDLTGGQWNTESALGVELARGVCQTCGITLVEATEDDVPDFAHAVHAAALAHATVVVTTFTPPEDPFDETVAADFSHPGTAFVAAAGEAATGDGYTGGVNFPSDLPGVLAVGGTVLRRGPSGAYGSESVWDSTVSGCSEQEYAGLWQLTDAAEVGCQARRAVVDIAALSEPGASVHITDSGSPGGPWFDADGTSVSAPIIAGVIGLAGSLGGNEASTLYARGLNDPGAFHDITHGDNGTGCIPIPSPYYNIAPTAALICQAGRGYDGPTGLGTPFGLAAFLRNGGALSRSHPRLTISSASGKLVLQRGGVTHFLLRNSNAFAVTGTVATSISFPLASGGTLAVTVAKGKLRLAPLGAESVKVPLTAVERQSLSRAGQLRLTIRLQVRGPVAPTVGKARALHLYP
ncbi:MAG TPA: S8 family serine peptidase [Solirubrobacteraceae bacterium]|nr:S8 family serine peptidase [Solirubrobacteraceae bacterium]